MVNLLCNLLKTGSFRHLILGVALAVTLPEASAVIDAGVPLSSLSPTVFAFEPGLDATPLKKSATFPDGSSHPALLLRYQSRIAYDVPPGQVSFRGVITRADIGSSEPPDPQGDFNRIRIRFALDGKLAYDTVLDTSMPPEQFAFPVGSAKRLTIAIDQMLAGGAVYLADAAFTTQRLSRAATFHVLVSGAAYANIGSTVEHVAFRAFHPGQAVPLQLEFAGLAQSGTVSLTIKSRQQSAPIPLTVPIALHANNGSSVGVGSWQVPSTLGPAELDLRATVNGKQVYERQLQIAIAREVDVARDSATSTFGVHLSSAGIPYLADSVADVWGAKWARIFLRWEVVEFDRGRYDWSRIDEIVNLYLAQHMEILGVLGETAPKWAAPSGAETTAAFNRFVKAAVEHFKGKIQYWDVYNEIDSKYHGGTVMDKTDPTADIRLLREEMSAIRTEQSDAKLVCCSTGTSYWLAYDKRLYDNGLLNLMDILSLHPYQSGPPEARDGVLNYVEMINNLRNLEHSYGANKPIWSSEANWLIGPAGQQGVTAPYVDDHAQSQYVVRVNLLSMALGVPYFVHSPFFTPFHRELFLDLLSSYANMTYNLGAATGARQLALPDGVYGITATSGSRIICVLWTMRRSAIARVSGMTGVRFQDMYGNAAAYDAAHIPLSGDPVYINGMGTPSVSVAQMEQVSAAKLLPAPWTWDKSLLRKYQQTSAGVRVTTNRTNYGNLLKSPAIAVSPDSCYVISTNIHTYSGGVAIVALDTATGKKLQPTINLFNVTGHDDYRPELKLRTGLASQIQVELIADNPNEPQVTDFEISQPQIAACEQ